MARDYGSAELHTPEDNDGLGVLGAHAFGFNRGRVGVALLGTCSPDGATATDDAREALTHLLSWKLGCRGIKPHDGSGYAKADGSVVRLANLCGHRDVLATGCPGDGLYRRLAEVRDGRPLGSRQVPRSPWGRLPLERASGRRGTGLPPAV